MVSSPEGVQAAAWLFEGSENKNYRKATAVAATVVAAGTTVGWEEEKEEEEEEGE